jgi:hypothetical protein
LSIPTIPLNLSPSGGNSIVVSVPNTFTWQSDSIQNAYYLEWSLNEVGGTIYNTGWIIDSLSQHIFNSGVFINTKIYKWRVKVRNSIGQESSFSDWAVFLGGNESSLSITFPAQDMDIVSQLPTYQHLFVPQSGFPQYSYQYLVYTGNATWNNIDNLTANQQESYTWDELELLDSQLVWDSTTVISTSTSVEQPPGYLIPGIYWYKVRCTVVDNQGNSYDSALRTYYILLDNVPQTPIIIATNDNANGRNTITITNPTPDPGQVPASYNKLYRKKLDGSWELLVDNITTSTTHDTTCRSSKQEEYSVSAIGTNGIESGKSTSAYATCKLESYWFTNLITNETVELTAEVNWGQMQSERKREEYQSIDEIYPSVCYSSQRFYRGNFQATVLKPTSSIWPVYCQQIVDVLNAGNNVLMRSPWGDLIKLDIYDFKINLFIRDDQARTISFNFVEMAETIPVGTYTYSTPTIEGYWVVDPTTKLGFQLYNETEWNGMTFERDRYEGIGLSSEFSTVNYGNKKAIRSGFEGVILKPDNGILVEEIMKLRELIDPLDKKPVEFWTPSGDKFLVDTYGFTYELFERTNQARKISFEFIEVGAIT